MSLRRLRTCSVSSPGRGWKSSNDKQATVRGGFGVIEDARLWIFARWQRLVHGVKMPLQASCGRPAKRLELQFLRDVSHHADHLGALRCFQWRRGAHARGSKLPGRAKDFLSLGLWLMTVSAGEFIVLKLSESDI